jgi:hypothetical protein
MHEQRKLARAKLNGYTSEGGGASQRVHRELAVRHHGCAIDEAVPATHERAHPREQLGVAERVACHVVSTGVERAQQAGRRLAARAHPQDRDAPGARRERIGSQRSQHFESTGGRHPEDHQIDLSRFAALGQGPGMTRSPDLVAVLFKLAGQRGIRALLAVHEQHASEAGRVPMWALRLLRVAIEDQAASFPHRGRDTPTSTPMAIRS